MIEKGQDVNIDEKLQSILEANQQLEDIIKAKATINFGKSQVVSINYYYQGHINFNNFLMI